MTLNVTVDRVGYHSPESGWVVLRCSLTEDPTEELTCVGNLPDPHVEGLILTVSGEWGYHQTFGRQFQFQQATVSRPTTLDGVRRYLANAIGGLGDHTARNIIEVLGERTIPVLDAGDPSPLTAIPGVGKVRAQSIIDQWAVGEENRQTQVNLMSLGLTPNLCARICAHYEQKGVDPWTVISANPFLLTEVWGVGFKTADTIARKLGFSMTDPRRVKAGIIHTLQQARDGEGHCYLPQGEVMGRVATLTGLLETQIGDLLAQDEAERPDEEVVSRGGELGWCDAFVLDYEGTDEFEGPRYYLPGSWADEVEVAERLRELLLVAPPPHSHLHEDALQARFETEVGFRLTDEQLGAVCALRSACGLAVLTGSPGVGKTAIVRALLIDAEHVGMSVRLAAPTGRAAKRMEELTGHEGTTIHRLLKWIEGGFVYDERNPLNVDLVVVDEASMLDIRLMRALVSAIQPGLTRLVLVGDADQLPSVGPGNVLRDVIASGLVTTCKLTQIMRQAEGSGIIVDSHRINRGEMPSLDWKDCTFVEADETAWAQEVIKSLVMNAKLETQVLTPQRTGDLGTRELNKLLQEAVNPARVGKGEFATGAGDRQRVFRAGDRVMQTKNDYNKMVFNGEVGYISVVDVKLKEIVVQFPDMTARYGTGDLWEIEHAFACTIHKAQGSQMEQVVVVAHNSMAYMLSRCLLYTGVSRAEKSVIVVGQKKAVEHSVRNNKIVRRYTRLKERMQDDEH